MGDPETQRSACTALDCLLEVLGNDIEPYIPSLMQALLALLDNAPLSLKSTVVGAIGSTAHASKTRFAPYFEASMQRIVPFLQLTEEGEELQLRGVAQDTVGTLAEAVGKDMFRPFYEPLMRAALEAIAVPNAPNLKECSYIFFAVMSRVFGEEFAPQLPTIMPILLGAVGQSEIDEAALFSGKAAPISDLVSAAEVRPLFQLQPTRQTLPPEWTAMTRTAISKTLTRKLILTKKKRSSVRAPPLRSRKSAPPMPSPKCSRTSEDPFCRILRNR